MADTAQPKPMGAHTSDSATRHGSEAGPGIVAAELGIGEVVEARAFQAAVAEHEAAGLDDVNGDTEAGAEAKQGPGVLRDVGLVEGEAHRPREARQRAV